MDRMGQGYSPRISSRYSPFPAQTNSIITRCPTNAAARCKLDSVMSRFGSRMRSTWERLVFSNTAMRALEIFFLHRPSQLPHNELLDGLRLRFLKYVFFLQEFVNARSHLFLSHL